MPRSWSRSPLWIVLIVAWLATPVQGARAAEPSGVEAVSFETSDGFVLHADLLAGSDPEAPALVLLHMYHSNRRAWRPLLSKLAAAGFTVLALDQRAHGESVHQGEHTVRVEVLSRTQFAELVRQGPLDVAAARRFLTERKLGRGGVALLGASYGCTVALLAAAQDESIRALVLLSPGTAYFGVDVLDEARAFRGRLLAVAAEDDPRSAKSARRIAAEHAGPDELKIYPKGGHGTRLFTPQPSVMDRVSDFLRAAFD